MGLRVRELRVDVAGADADTAVRWWAAALGGTPRAVDEWSTRLDGVRSRVGVRVRRLDAGPSRYRLVVEGEDPERAVGRLTGLGATDLGGAQDGDEGARLLADPAGLRLEVTTTREPQPLSDDRDDLHLRVVMLDVPAAVAAEEARFWAAALEGEALPVGDQYPDYTWIRPAAGPGGPINLCVQATHGDESRLHVDLHCPDVAARDEQVERVTAAGASVVDRRDHWVVVRAPGGQLACIVPDRR